MAPELIYDNANQEGALDRAAKTFKELGSNFSSRKLATGLVTGALSVAGAFAAEGTGTFPSSADGAVACSTSNASHPKVTLKLVGPKIIQPDQSMKYTVTETTNTPLNAVSISVLSRKNYHWKDNLKCGQTKKHDIVENYGAITDKQRADNPGTTTFYAPLFLQAAKNRLIISRKRYLLRYPDQTAPTGTTG